MANRITEMTAASSLTGDELVEVSQLSPSVTITATTISAAASDNSFNDSGSGFVTAGFAVGDRVKVEGFTSSVNNLFFGVIASVAAGKITIEAPEGDNILDEAAGDSVTITKWTTRRTTGQAIGDLGGGGGGGAQTITESGTSANLLNSNAGTYQRWTNASDKTLTVQPNATEAIDADAEFTLRNVGAGTLTISEGSGVTVNPPDGGSLVLLAGMTATLKRVAVDEFDLIGHTDLAT